MAEFAAGAAHELNNPLAIIAGRAQLLRAGSTTPRPAPSLQTIISQARRAHRILRDLIYVARPPPPRQVACVPDQVLRAAVDDLVREAGPAGSACSCRLDREATRGRSTDPEALRHLADVLLRNALEATPERRRGRGPIHRRSSISGLDRPRRGLGLDAEAAAHLLDPFYCGRQAGRGLGMGLPRVARFVRSVGGHDPLGLGQGRRHDRPRRRCPWPTSGEGDDAKIAG